MVRPLSSNGSNRDSQNSTDGLRTNAGTWAWELRSVVPDGVEVQAARSRLIIPPHNFAPSPCLPEVTEGLGVPLRRQRTKALDFGIHIARPVSRRQGGVSESFDGLLRDGGRSAAPRRF
jgi:hypothetical protein